MMGERYWITGGQLVMILCSNNKLELKELIDEIIDEQFIRNYPSDEDKKSFLKEIELMRMNFELKK